MQLAFDPRKNLIPAFETPIGHFVLPNAAEINPGLVSAVLERKARDQNEGMSRSNIGGWHSDEKLFSWPVPEIRTLEDAARSAIMHMIGFTSKIQRFDAALEIYGWANVNSGDAYNRVHNHPQTHWSGCYYVKTGDQQQQAGAAAGNIEFYDPRGGVNMMTHPGNSNFGMSMVLPSIEGHMLLFPAWLFHSVNPTLSSEDRISIAFNARITSFKSTV